MVEEFLLYQSGNNIVTRYEFVRWKVPARGYIHVPIVAIDIRRLAFASYKCY